MNKSNNHQKSSTIDLKTCCLFLNDTLTTYNIEPFEIKYNYHSYSGNYKQLPDYSSNSLQNLNDISYEIDQNQVSTLFFYCCC
jgi:hypothetical protein